MCPDGMRSWKGNRRLQKSIRRDFRNNNKKPRYDGDGPEITRDDFEIGGSFDNSNSRLGVWLTLFLIGLALLLIAFGIF